MPRKIERGTFLEIPVGFFRYSHNSYTYLILLCVITKPLPRFNLQIPGDMSIFVFYCVNCVITNLRPRFNLLISGDWPLRTSFPISIKSRYSLNLQVFRKSISNSVPHSEYYFIKKMTSPAD